MAVNLTKPSRVVREVTPVHLISEEETMHSIQNTVAGSKDVGTVRREVTPVHLLDEEETVQNAIVDNKNTGTELMATEDDTDADKSTNKPENGTAGVGSTTELLVDALPQLLVGLAFLVLLAFFGDGIHAFLIERYPEEVGEPLYTIFRIFCSLTTVIMMGSGVAHLLHAVFPVMRFR